MLQDWHLLASIQELPLVLQGCTARVQLLAACRKRWIARKLPRQVQDLWSKQVADIYTIYETKNVAFACATFSKVVSNCKKMERVPVRRGKNALPRGPRAADVRRPCYPYLATSSLNVCPRVGLSPFQRYTLHACKKVLWFVGPLLGLPPNECFMEEKSD